MKRLLLLLLLICSNSFATDYYWDLTIDHTKVDASQSDFTILIIESQVPAGAWAHITDTTGANLSASANTVSDFPTGGDIYAKEVVSMNTSAETCEIHVNVPSVSSSVDTVVRIWIGDTETVANSTSAWNSDYEAVYHMTNLNDSTSNGYNLTGVNSPTATTGKIGGAYDFNGSDQYAYINSTIIATEPCTVIAYAYADARNGSVCSFTDKDVLTRFHGVVVENATTNLQVYSYKTDFTTSSKSGYNLSTWSFCTGVWVSATSRTVYLDASAGTESTANQGFADIDRFAIGSLARSSISSYFNGKIDEVRVISDDLTANDITTIYNMLNSPTTFYSDVGALTDATGTPPGATNTTKNQVIWFN